MARQAGLAASDASYLAGAGPAAQASFGSDVWSATLRATMKPLRRPKPGEKPREIHVVGVRCPAAWHCRDPSLARRIAARKGLVRHEA